MKTQSEPIALTRKAVAAKLKKYRNDRSLTQEKLAKRLAIKRANLGAYEECRATPPAWVMDRICELLEVSFKELIK